MKSYVWMALLIIAALSMAGCGPAAVSTEPEAETAAPVEAFGLAGTFWTLSALDGDLPVPGSSVTLEFGGDGTVSGSDGCNNFNTSFVQDGYDLTVAQPAAMTMMACSAAIMNQGAAFIDVLAQTNTFTATKRQLILMDGNQILATFVAVAQTTVDTSWDVTSYNNGRDAVVGLLLGTEISANFLADGTVNGNAGCNDYFATYTLDGNAVTISQPGTTFRLCDAPAGVMEQEAEFLAALTSSATFSIRGDILESRTAGDQMAVVMKRKLLVDLPQPEPAPEVAWGRVVAPAGVNIRSGPGVNFPVIAAARDGDEGEIIGRDAASRWWAAAIPSLPEGIGWVSADLVAATNIANVPVIEAAPPPVVPPTAPPPATPTPVPAATATPSAQISFSADRTAINQGECVTLQWNVQNVRAIWVYPRGQNFEQFPRAGQGNEVVCPPVTTTYEMRVQRRDGGIELREVTINVTATAQPQISFWADRTTVNQGDCTRLHWDVQNVQGVWVYPQGERYDRFPRVGQDSERVCPSNTTTYEMRVLQRDGSTVFRTVTVNVNAAPTPTPVPAPANPLAGTRWEAVNINDGSGLSTLILDTTATVEFGGNGQANGNAGCNTFNAPYSVNGSSINIGAPSSGMVFCADPEGLMAQEANFLAALQSAATFRLDGNTLELQNSGGRITTILQRR